MGHADKSWTVPDPARRTLVWRRAAFVAAVVLARGRVVATWSHRVRRGRLVVEVTRQYYHSHCSKFFLERENSSQSLSGRSGPRTLMTKRRTS